MKRSDMISLISNFIYELNVEPDECDAISDKILTKMEDAGMLPPFNNVVYYNSWRDGGTGHVWEKE